MYESSFRLSRQPFAPAPHADLYIATGSVEQARQTLVRTIERAEGPGLVVGPAGSGKSLLCQVLAKHFCGRLHVALLSTARLCTRRALLQNILFELKLPYRAMDEGELRLSLLDHLEPRVGGPEGLLLLVDEAHTLPLRLLEEIRLLTNVVRDGQSRVRLVLAGNMALEERLASPKLASFHQRIAARCYLQSLTRDETIGYVQEQIRRAGGSPESIFTPDALRAIHAAADGVPRLINQVCDHALMLASLGGHKQLGAEGIEEAWADLQQLPVPWHEPAQIAAGGSGVVEFGQLADEVERPVVAGTIRPNVAEAAVTHLDAIQRTINLLGEGDSLAASEMAAGMITGTAADDFSPVSDNGTEVELVFHSAHDPFGTHWDEEEVVIDRYASLEDKTLRNRQRTTSIEGRAIGAAVAAALDKPSVAPPPLPLDDYDAEPEPAIAAFHPASDPLLPEAAPQPARTRRAAISLRSIADDDRDIIVVEDEATRRPAPLSARPKRPEYRQLFSSLRNKG